MGYYFFNIFLFILYLFIFCLQYVSEEFQGWREEIMPFWMNDWQKRKILRQIGTLFDFFIYPRRFPGTSGQKWYII